MPAKLVRWTDEAGRRQLEGGSAITRSPEIRSGARLVTSTDITRAADANSAMIGAAPRTCSRLSSTSKPLRVDSASLRVATGSTFKVSTSPKACTIAGATRPGSVMSARATNATPSGNDDPKRRATSIAARVLPAPPRPVTVVAGTAGSTTNAARSRRKGSHPHERRPRVRQTPGRTGKRVALVSSC